MNEPTEPEKRIIELTERVVSLETKNKNPTYPNKSPEEIAELCFIQIANLTKKIAEVEKEFKDHKEDFGLHKRGF